MHNTTVFCIEKLFIKVTTKLVKWAVTPKFWFGAYNIRQVCYHWYCICVKCIFYNSECGGQNVMLRLSHDNGAKHNIWCEILNQPIYV